MANRNTRLSVVLSARTDRAIQAQCERWDRGYSEVADEAIRVGLRSMNGNGSAEPPNSLQGKTVRLQFRLQEETVETLRVAVADSGLSQSEVIRLALRAGLPVAYRRQHQRSARQEWRAQGLCVSCGSPEKQTGRLTCAPCGKAAEQRNRQRSERRREVARTDPTICSRCLEKPSLEGYRWCPECQEWQRERMRKYWQKRRASS